MENRRYRSFCILYLLLLLIFVAENPTLDGLITMGLLWWTPVAPLAAQDAGDEPVVLAAVEAVHAAGEYPFGYKTEGWLDFINQLLGNRVWRDEHRHIDWRVCYLADSLNILV